MAGRTLRGTAFHSARYPAEWLEVLKADKRAVHSDAAHAQRTADLLYGLQGKAKSKGRCRAAIKL